VTGADQRPLSALPSRRARALAFLAILVAGVCGGVIGSSFVNLQCEGDCSTPSGIGALVGAAVAAGGVAVVAVLVLRAMGEWRATVGAEDEHRDDGRGRPPLP
jgi:hypothetical protein